MMNATGIRLIGIIAIFCVFLFPVQTGHSRIKAEKRKTANMNYKFDQLIELRIGQKARIEPTLSIELVSFSHKRPYPGGPAKATAYLIISNGKATEEIMLSVHGVQGKPESEDGLSESDRYDFIIWKKYIIRLKSFNYDRSVKLIVSGIEK